MCQHSQRWQLQKRVGVSKQLGWGSPGSVLCGHHPHQPLFPVCAHACACTHARAHTHTHTHTRFRSMQLPSPATLVSSVCTHAHTHTHTHTRFRSMRSPSPPTLVSSVCTHVGAHTHTHTVQVYAVAIPTNPCFQCVPTHVHTQTHTCYLPSQRPYSSRLGRTSLPWALALARPAGEGVVGTSPGLAPKAGCTPI